MRNIHRPVFVAKKSAAKKVASVTTESVVANLRRQAVVPCALESKQARIKTSFSPPFRYSQLAYGLSLCLLAPTLMVMAPPALAANSGASSAQQPQRQSATQVTPQQAIDHASSVATKELQPSNQAGKQTAQSDESLEQALIALRLKRAVEQGLVDLSVLEAYQRETLNSGSNQSPSQATEKQSASNQSKTSSQSASNQAKNQQASLGQPLPKQKADKMTADQSQSYPLPPDSPSEMTSDLPSESLSGLSSDQSRPKAMNKSEQDSEAIFSRVFIDSSLDNQALESELSAIESMHTPEQLDLLLNDIGAQLSTDFEQPIARLDANEPPLGLKAQPALLPPSNSETLGFKQSSATEDTSASNSADQATQPTATEPVYQAKDVTVDPSKAASEKETSDGSAQTADSSDNQQAEINPDDYLPEYQREAGTAGLDRDQQALVVQDAEDDAKPGIVKRLYNRFFNDGVSGLPRVKAKVYLNTTETPLGAEEFAAAVSRSDPRLVVADKNTQPFANIKAALENIPVGSIADFNAASPKLYQEALNAAQAVGFYDIKFSFRKVSSDKVAVVVEHLGDPVKVSSRIIDIRGEGQDLEQFQTIVEQLPPKVGDVFNHGVYEKTKREIETTKEQLGFFDGEWLNRSVDVILPDNTADIDLIYDTGERYRFDEVVFFTIDKETGQLTTDPDKLPVRADLLHQLHEFKVGDSFSAPLVTKFANDLSMTRYFNSVNVETIRPGVSRGVLGFEEIEDEDAAVDTELAAEGDGSTESGTLAASDNKPSSDNKQSGNKDSTATNADQEGITAEASDTDDFDEEFAPLVYAVDAETTAKVAQIREKAERLSRLPGDRVLDEVEAEAKSLLGKIANTISNTVKKILPDEKDPLADSAALPEDLSQTVLANRKTPQQVAETKSVPLYVFVSADKPRDMDIGIGYGTDTGVRAVTRLENNLINKDGYQAGITVGASRINRNISLHGSRPWKHPLDDTLTGNISFEQEEINQGKGNLDLETNTIQAGIARNIRKEDGWNQTFSLRYRYDDLESGVEGAARENLPVPFNREGAKLEQEALLLGYQIDRTKADNPLNPTKGWRQYYSIEAGSKDVLTDTNMAIARAGVSGLYSFGEHNKHQVLASLDGGYIWANEFEEVPYKLRFFAGGDRSIRGYDYNSLSALEKGYLVGGQVLAVGSAEYNYEFKPGLRGAVFADVGNAYDKDFEAETKLGVGFGIRWASPVGMVRVDLGAGVLEDSIPVRLHFFIGSPLQ